MKQIIGYSIVTHYDDKSTETTKIPGDRLILQVGGSQSKYTYLNADECPIHGPWRAVPAGSKNGRDYPAFWACDQQRDEPRCTNRPSKDWVETHPPERVLPTTTAEDFDDLPF